MDLHHALGHDPKKPRSEAQKRAIATFRQRYRRFDYTPGEAALAVIERVRAERPELSTRLVIDLLVKAGDAYHRQHGSGSKA